MALVMEVYREVGMKFDDAHTTLQAAISGEEQAAGNRPPAPQDEAAGLAMLESMMRGSDFKGVKK